MDVKEQNLNGSDFRRHPWEIVRLEFVFETLNKIYGDKPAPGDILDIGCGDLYVSKNVADYFSGSSIVSVDTAYENVFNLGRIQAVNSLDKVPCRIYSLILLLDVLEHVEDDMGFLQNLVNQYSSPETFFLITVPLHPFLFSEHDIYLRHKRRYSYSELLFKIQGAGLKIVDSGNLFSSLLIFRTLQIILGKFFAKLRPGRKGSTFADVANWNHSILLTRLAKIILRFDINYARRFPGLSGYALASPRG